MSEHRTYAAKRAAAAKADAKRWAKLADRDDLDEWSPGGFDPYEGDELDDDDQGAELVEPDEPAKANPRPVWPMVLGAAAGLVLLWALSRQGAPRG
jgi:hypothetical protein